jgi:zinc transport system permease protein
MLLLGIAGEGGIMSFWCGLMDLMPFEWAAYAFMQRALLGVVLMAPLFAMLGCLVINNQMAFFSDALGHAALTGIAIGVMAGLGNPVWAMAGFSILLALAISLLRRYSASSTDTVIGLVMSFAVALGVVLLSRGGQFSRYMGYLIGDILTISRGDLLGILALWAVVGGVWLPAYNRLVLVFVNRSLARSRGVPVWAVEACFACLVAVVVTVSIPWVGLLVINSLLILPAAAARNLARSAAQYQALAVLISLVSGVAGLLASFYLGTAAGATIVLTAMGLYLVSVVLRRA